MCHAMKLSPYVLCFVTLTAGCAEVVAGSPGDASVPREDATGADAHRPVDAGGCELPGGGFCPLDGVCPAGDGCNPCRCTARGIECTLIGCVVPDAAVDAPTPSDAPPAVDAGGCALPDGGWCLNGATCPADDGCNMCRCTPTGATMCTILGCAPDGGPRGCRSRADCHPSEDCLFSAPGCDTRGTCGSPRDCAAIVEHCGCDGVTFRDCPGTTSQPYRAAGACPSDGGAPDRCNGAHIGRGGGYCAGPSDAPLPLDCCRWNCDTRLAVCASLPPACTGGMVNTVSTGCWGPCVPPSACMPVVCGEGNTCPSGWRCNPMDRRCVPVG